MTPIHTSRLTLRRPRPDDLDAFAAFCASDRAAWVGGPADRAEAWDGLAMTLGHWEMLGYGYFHADLTETGACVGRFGVLWPERRAEPEIAWTLFDAAHEGKGLASEGAKAARAHAHGTLGFASVVSYIDEKNARSIALAQRLGCTRDPDAPIGPGREGLAVWRHPAPEALQ